jgi:hypothetical protein
MGASAFTGTKKLGRAGRQAVRSWERPPGHNGMAVGVVREWPAPGVQAPGKPQEIGSDEALIFGELFKSHGRGLTQGLVRGALMRADKGTQGLRDRAGEEAGRSRELFGEVGLEPLVRFMLLTLGAVAIATGMLDALLSATGWALREAVAVRTALARWDGADDLAVRGGKRGRALQGLWGRGRADFTQGDHGRSPCRSALRRSEASAGPVWGRGRERRVGSSWVCPRERWRSRGWTPAASRWVAYACRSVWMAPPILASSARCLAVRQAPWTRERRMGERAVGLCWCSRPVAGKSQVGCRWVFQEVRSSASVSAGKGT